MLPASLRGKLRGRGNCAECESEVHASFTFETSLEDAVTSTILGALRYLPRHAGIDRILAWLKHDCGPGPVTIDFWPSAPVAFVGLGERHASTARCEPDAVIQGDVLVVIEAKLGSALGADPLQLPKEVTFAHQRAGGRPWRVLAISADSQEPQHPRFAAVDDQLNRVGSGGLRESVASYFAAVEQLVPGLGLPSPDDVAKRIDWMSWRSVLDLLLSGHSEESHDWNLMTDVRKFATAAALWNPPFGGFSAVSAERIAPLEWTIRRRSS